MFGRDYVRVLMDLLMKYLDPFMWNGSSRGFMIEVLILFVFLVDREKCCIFSWTKYRMDWRLSYCEKRQILARRVLGFNLTSDLLYLSL